MIIIYALLFGAIITIMIEYVDWDSLMGKMIGEKKEKKEKKSVINRSVAGSILLVLLIAFIASCV